MFELLVWTGFLIFLLCLAVIFGVYVKLYRSLKKDYSEQIRRNTLLNAELKQKSQSCSSQSLIGKATRYSLKSSESKASSSENESSLITVEGYLIESIKLEELNGCSKTEGNIKETSRYASETMNSVSRVSSKSSKTQDESLTKYSQMAIARERSRTDDLA